MWSEVLPTDSTLLLKFCHAQNNLSCAYLRKDLTTTLLKDQLRKKEDCHAYYYEDDKFKIIIQYKQNQTYDKIQIIKYTINWDFTDKSIDIFDAIRILFKHNRQYLIERNEKEVYLHTTPSSFPEAQMLWYVKEKIIEIGLEEGINCSVVKKGTEDWWYLVVV